MYIWGVHWGHSTFHTKVIVHSKWRSTSSLISPLCHSCNHSFRCSSCPWIPWYQCCPPSTRTLALHSLVIFFPPFSSPFFFLLSSFLSFSLPLFPLLCLQSPWQRRKWERCLSWECWLVCWCNGNEDDDKNDCTENASMPVLGRKDSVYDRECSFIHFLKRVSTEDEKYPIWRF